MVAEVLRGGAFSDDVVINLVNRRFVANYYDVAPPKNNFGDAWAYDEEAIRTIGDVHGKGGGGTQEPNGRVRADAYPTAIFVTPAGKRLDADVFGIIPPAPFVERLRKVIRDYPEWFKPTQEELEIETAATTNPKDPAAQLADARLAWELADWDRCLRRVAMGLAASPPARVSAEFRYLEGRVHTCSGAFDKALAALDQAAAALKDPSNPLMDDIEAAQARVLLNQDKLDDALKSYQRMIEMHPKGIRLGEALYYSGLCHYRQGRKEEAKKLWRRHRENLPGDRLARRSAISLGLPEAEAFLNQEIIDRKGWW